MEPAGCPVARHGGQSWCAVLEDIDLHSTWQALLVLCSMCLCCRVIHCHECNWGACAAECIPKPDPSMHLVRLGMSTNLWACRFGRWAGNRPCASSSEQSSATAPVLRWAAYLLCRAIGKHLPKHLDVLARLNGTAPATIAA